MNEKFKEAQSNINQLEFDIHEAQSKLRIEKRKVEEVRVEEFAKQLKALFEETGERNLEVRDIEIYVRDFVQKIKDLHR